MFRNVKRAIVSFVWVALAFGIYVLIVAPFIDRSLHNGSTDDDLVDLESISSSSADRFVPELTPLFPEGSWELGQPTVLRSPQATVLLKEFEELEDGSLRVRPCTLVFYGSDRDAVSPSSGPTVMQAPEGAILRFDELDLANAKIGKPLSGQLVGPIRISRQGGSDSETLVLETSNVLISGQRVWTSEVVSFQLGNNFGIGRDLMLTRSPAGVDGSSNGSTGDRKGGSWLDELGIIELQHLERLSLQLDNDVMLKSIGNAGGSADRTGPSVSLMAGQNPAMQQHGVPQPPTRVDVRCSGPLRFDLRRMIATVEDNVQIIRKQPNAPVDVLQAGQLSMHFARVEKSKRIDGKSDDDQKSLSLTRIVAVGEPMVIDAPSYGVYVETKRLEYDFATRTAKFRARNPFATSPAVEEQNDNVLMRNAQHEIIAPSIDFIGGDDSTQWQLVTDGPGQYAGSAEQLNGKKVRATWNKSLSLQPYEGLQVLRLDGAASVQSEELGRIRADLMELRVRADRTPVATRLDGTVVYETRYVPQQLESRAAKGRLVQIDTPQFFGALERLTVMFQQDSPPRADNGASPNPMASLSGGGDGGAGLASGRPAERFRVEGGELGVWVNSQSQQLHRVALHGPSRLIRRSTDATQDMEVAGDEIVFQLDELGRPIATLLGSPAELKLAEMRLRGKDIRFFGDQNRVMIPGPGSAVLPMNASVANAGGMAFGSPSNASGGPQSRPANASPTRYVDVQWRDGLQFDGRVVTLLGQVAATGPDLSLRTQSDLEITLDRTIDFSQLNSQQEPQPVIARIATADAVYMANQSRDELGNATSYQQMSTRDWQMDMLTGDVVASGPGWLSVTSPAERLPSMPGQPKPSSPATSSSRSGLAQLSVVFGNRLTGNLHRREAKLDGNVRGFFGPVAKWDDRIDPQQPTELRDGEYRISCQEVFLSESPTAGPIDPTNPNSRKPVDLLLLGETYVEGAQFAARGAQIKYAEEKDMLTLEGDSRRPAELFQRSLDGGPPSQSGRARRIRFRPKTGELEVDGGLGVDLTANGQLGR